MGTSAPAATGRATDPEAAAPGPHPSRQSLARALSGTAHADEVRLELLVHLIACCPECRSTVESLAELAHEYGHWDIAEALVEWREAPLLWGRLGPLPFEEQLAAIDTEEDFWTWGLCRFLQLRSADQVAENPAGAANLAALALRVGRNLGESYDLTWVRGLRALCLASLANARRQLGEIHAAADAVTAARRLIDAGGGTGNDAFEAEVLVVAGLVARDRRRLREALGYFEAAQALLAPPAPAGEVADQELLAAALAHQAWCLYHLGNPAAALDRLAAAARHNDPGRDPVLARGILLGQLWGALGLGHLDQARHLLELAREAAAGEPGPFPATAAVAEPVQRHPAGPEAEAPQPEPPNQPPADVAPLDLSPPGPVPSEPGSAAGHSASSVTTPRPKPAAAPQEPPPLPPPASAPVLRRAAARIALATGHRTAAEDQLLAAVVGLLDEGQGVEAALAFLDLAALLLDDGDGRELSEAAADLIPELLTRETDLTAADGAALLRLQQVCAAHQRSPFPAFAEVLAERPPLSEAGPRLRLMRPGESLPQESVASDDRTTAEQVANEAVPGHHVPAEHVPGQLTPGLLRQIAAGIERRRRPELTWWSGGVPLAAEEDESHGDLGV